MNALLRCATAGLLVFSINGCAADRSLSPLPGGEQVSITVRVPQNLEAKPMRVMYRSEKCPIKRSGPGSTSYKEDGYLATTVQLQRQSQSDVYEAKLPVDGGSVCQWRLSNVTFGVSYANTTSFGENVSTGGGGGVIVIFDDHLPQQRSVFEPTVEVYGDLLIGGDYYPWVSEAFLGGYEKLARLVGKGDIYLTYKAKSARKVTFEPNLHADFVVFSVEPKVKQKGSYTQFTYPDGSVVANGVSKPNFQKLQAIRLGQTK
jgi:hypothetical protein